MWRRKRITVSQIWEKFEQDVNSIETNNGALPGIPISREKSAEFRDKKAKERTRATSDWEINSMSV